jgi:hypothetical protein
VTGTAIRTSSMTTEGRMDLTQWCCRAWLTMVVWSDADVGYATARVLRGARVGTMWQPTSGARPVMGGATQRSSTGVDGDRSGAAARSVPRRCSLTRRAWPTLTSPDLQHLVWQRDKRQRRGGKIDISSSRSHISGHLNGVYWTKLGWNGMEGNKIWSIAHMCTRTFQ